MTQPTLACESVESVASYPKTSTEELNQSGCHKRCPRGVPEASQGGVEPAGGGPLHMKFSRDAAISRIPAPHLLKQGQLQLAGATSSFRDVCVCVTVCVCVCVLVLSFVTMLVAQRHSAPGTGVSSKRVPTRPWRRTGAGEGLQSSELR